MTEFHVPASQQSLEYLEEIAAEMCSLFGIDRIEAVGRFNKFWEEHRFFSREYEWLLRHETPEYWAKTIYYEENVAWWLGEEGLSPRPYSSDTRDDEAT